VSLDRLNEKQREAVRTTEGRVLILAGAGSGKTSVLTHRAAYLIREKGVPPEAILGLTFTNKAAEEMRHRLAVMIGAPSAKKTTLCTFHSFCMQVLRREIQHLGYTPHFSLYDEKDVKRLLTQLARHALACDAELPSLESTMAKIAQAKNAGGFAEEGTTWHDAFSRDLFDRLQHLMRAYNAVDFDSLLTLTVQLFEEHPAVLRRYQQQYRYIMIDEYQDTNPIQYRLAAHLSAVHHNLCVVGDDDQSIYGWRGAKIQYILNFPASCVIKLEQNYRSTPTILQAANAVIAHNRERHAKHLWSDRAAGDLITLFHAPTDQEEAQSVAQRLIWHRKQYGLKWKEMAILYRSNLLARPLEAALLQTAWEKEGQWIRGIPYQVCGGTEFFERSEIKDIMAYLRAILNPLDEEALLRIINVPRRGIAAQTLDHLTQHNRTQSIPLWDAILSPPEGLSDKARASLRAFADLMARARDRFRSPPLHAALDWLLHEVHYKKAIEEDVKSDAMRAFKWDNALACVQALKRYEEETPAEDVSLHHFLTHSALNREPAMLRCAEQQEDKVSLMTFHSAKGLEFAACFCIGLEDHIIPHEKSASETGVEEERRLLYVALTRAKRHLTLSMARKRKRMGKEANSAPSRFLFEIPKELVKVASWQTIG
jgi:superfamily I DNA/RNA helicase